MNLTARLLAVAWVGLWLTPDQEAQRLMNQREFAKAAETFTEPMRQGAAWYRAGEFARAEQAFARVGTPEGRYNQGNAWLMQGKYSQAIDCYELALRQRPDWREARENRDLAAARDQLKKQTGGDLGDQQEGADQVVFDKQKQPGGQETEVAGETAATDASVQAIWLRQVQTKPADFLKAKFAYQQSLRAEGSTK